MKYETGKSSSENIQYRKYRLNPRKCAVVIGDIVTPETVVGMEHETGQPVRAGIRGQVITMYHNPNNDSLVMLAVISADKRER
ncbi:MAG: hypothetical protein WC370_09930 [Dehalococcoidales bacterium]|jgi:hypothetical protein